MPNPSFLGYLNNPYLQDPYLGDTGFHAWGSQIDRIITTAPPYGSEIERVINAADATGSEIQLFQDHVVGSEVRRLLLEDDATGSEVQHTIANKQRSVGSEISRIIADRRRTLGSEILRTIKAEAELGSEVDRTISSARKTFGSEIRLDHSIAHWDRGYLEEDYLETPYLGPGMYGQMGAMVERFIKNHGDARASEVLRREVDRTRTFGSEVKRIIADRQRSLASQVIRLKDKTFGSQVRMVLYNTNRLRILCDFPSRGVSGINWSSTSTQAGDFSPNNLNTDIVEQRWQSGSGVTSVVLTCDTEIVQGTAIDTLAMFEHNLTTSATIVVEGSDNGSFSPVEESFNVTPTRRNAYYIAPTFPTVQSRYRRLIISDPTNPDGYLRIGTLVFGTSTIFQVENFTDEIVRRNKHFADRVETEAFTNVSNDRALKRGIVLTFKNIRYLRGNFRAIEAIFEEDRTSQKCVWIPTPDDPTRFGVFAKLVEVPDETHVNMGDDSNNTVDFTTDLDESM